MNRLTMSRRGVDRTLILLPPQEALAEYPLRMAPSHRKKPDIFGPYLVAAIGLGLLYWVIDAAFMAFVIHEGNWLDQIISPGPDDVWMRSFTFAVLIGAGAMINSLAARRESLLERDAGLGRIIETSLNEIFIFGAETLTFLEVNRGARENLGYSMEELRKMTPLDIKPEHTMETFNDLIEPLCSGGQEQIVFDTVHQRKDGSTYPVEVHLQLTTYAGQPVFAAIILDTTQRMEAREARKQLETQIQQAQKLESLGLLAGGIAHDFNNLLVGILGNADLALHDLSPTSPGRDYLADIVTAAQRAAELCKQMLAYSGKGKFVVRAVDVSRSVEEMLHLLQVSISKSVILKFNFEPNLPTVEADVTQLRQVIMNLITNASEAIGDRSGIITVSTGAMDCTREYLHETYLDDSLTEGVYVTVEISDTGQGMDELTREHIFDPFFTTKFTGRGLGLAAVLGIVRGHKGAIKVYSEPGKGTTFKVLLPASDQPAEDGTEETSEATEWKSEGTVLVVDDEETVRALAKRMLASIGIEVLTAEDGQVGVDLYRENMSTISLVLLDMTMPRLDGKEAFRQMRSINPDVRVILTSGYNEQEVTSSFAGKGIAGFIQKPFRRDALVEVVRKELE